MSALYIDQKYLLLISSGLRNFKQKKENLYNFSCVFCGDSHKNKRKARGYVYEHQGSYVFKCHNCAHTTSLANLIKEVDIAIYKQYVIESFNNTQPYHKETITKSTSVFNTETEIALETLEMLPDSHWVLDYVRHRQIPRPFWSRLYFAPDFKNFVESVYPEKLNHKEHGMNIPDDDPRLIIPFYNEYKILCGFQGRALKNFELRYITIKLTDTIKCYGMDTVDFSEKIYVLEGPIDSMFLPNAVATLDSDLARAAKWLPKKNLVLVFDNQYDNKDVRRLLERSIDQGFNVCIFPKSIKRKDINDLIIKEGLTSEKIKCIVDENTFSGLRAKMELVKHG